MLTCTRSSAYPVYAKVLEDIHAVVRAIDIAAYNACTARPSSRAPHSQRTYQRGNDRSDLDHSAGIGSSHTNRVSKRGRKPSYASATSNNIQVAAALDELDTKNFGRRVGCPVHKHHVMCGTDPPCRGCSVGVMSQLRSHLNPNRAGTHRGFPAFVAHCSCCEQDFVQEDVYESHLENRCQPQPQIRNDIVLCWGRLYLALYPNARRIPSPWANETGWLPDSERRRCLAPVPNSPLSGPFLERHQRRDSSHRQTPPAVVNPPEDPAYDGVMGLLLSDFVEPRFPSSIHSEAASPNPRRQVEPNLHTSSANIAAFGAPYWPNSVPDVSTQRTIRQGATHFTEDQILSAARECERMYYIIIAMRQEQLARQALHP
jgi:hypothetical protein